MRRSMLAGLATLTLSALATPALAADPLNFDFTSQISQADYEKLIQPITTPMRFMFVGPAQGGGLMGFDVGIAGSLIDVPQEARDIATRALDGGSDLPATLVLPRLTVQKGLPLGIDLAINYAMVPSTDIQLLGFGGQYELELPIPVLPIYAGVRGTYSMLTGLDELSSSHFGLEALVSAQLLPAVPMLGIQPWLGVGFDSADANSDLKLPTGTTVPLESDWTDTYVLAGAQFSLALVRIAAEAQFSLSDQNPIYNLKLSFGM